MAKREGIACDFCDKPLDPFPVLVVGVGWSYVWSEMEIGAASFAYASCNECCAKERPHSDKLDACIKRASRHGKGWRLAVDRFIVKTQCGL